MVERQIAARGVKDARVLDAMGQVPRERFVSAEVADLAYEDRPLPIPEGQTISQPYIVALMLEAADLEPADRVLEVGTGSGYAAAVMSRIADEVYTIERHEPLADLARRRFADLRYDNIDVLVGDGTLGWREHAPYDAIVVAAGGPDVVPPALKEQLAPGGVLVIPKGATLQGQDLVRIRRSADGTSFEEESLGAVRFVPLVGKAGWGEDGAPPSRGGGAAAAPHTKPRELPDVVGDSAEAFDDIESADLDALLDRIGDARLVLLGEASHGTSEFYRMRARITRELIERKGFDFVAAEADWPDAAELDAYVRHHPKERPHKKPFQRFPRWMWANTDVLEFIHWLREFNEPHSKGSPEELVGFHGMDLYSMHASMEAVIHYLEDVDPEAAEVARDRYGCLAPWQNDPVLYGRAVLSGRFDECENEVMAMLRDLLEARMSYIRRDGNRFVDAIQNARLVANAERYYKSMYRGSVSSWNLRDQHMFETLELLLSVYGEGSKGIVWAHNSHLGDAAHTEMGERGEHNVGQLCREEFGDDAYLVGFGTHTGTVAAASDWDEPMQVMEVQPSHPRSYERVAHESGVERFFLPLRSPDDPEVRKRLEEKRLERAIGVIYRPRTELQSHYFRASLPNQFDEWIWFDESEAVTPISEKSPEELDEMGLPDTYPFGV